MKNRSIADRNVGVIGLGAMALFEYDPKPSDKEAIDLLRYAVKIGVKLIDTADVYGLGRNEKQIGALTAQEKNEILIATKVGCTRPGGGWGTDGRPIHIKEGIKGSLEKLGLNSIELYQLHTPDHRVPFKNSIKALKELKESGLVKHIGLSNVNLQQLQEAQKIVRIVSVQNRYNVSHKVDEQYLLPYLTNNNIAYLPYFPLGAGKLIRNPKLIAISEKIGLTPSQAALAWIITKWPTALPIPGTRSKKHLEENMNSANIELSDNIVNELDSLY